VYPCAGLNEANYTAEYGARRGTRTWGIKISLTTIITGFYLLRGRQETEEPGTFLKLKFISYFLPASRFKVLIGTSSVQRIRLNVV